MSSSLNGEMLTAAPAAATVCKNARRVVAASGERVGQGQILPLARAGAGKLRSFLPGGDGGGVVAGDRQGQAEIVEERQIVLRQLQPFAICILGALVIAEAVAGDADPVVAARIGTGAKRRLELIDGERRLIEPQEGVAQPPQSVGVGGPADASAPSTAMV